MDRFPSLIGPFGACSPRGRDKKTISNGRGFALSFSAAAIPLHRWLGRVCPGLFFRLWPGWTSPLQPSGSRFWPRRHPQLCRPLPCCPPLTHENSEGASSSWTWGLGLWWLLGMEGVKVGGRCPGIDSIASQSAPWLSASPPPCAGGPLKPSSESLWLNVKRHFGLFVVWLYWCYWYVETMSGLLSWTGLRRLPGLSFLVGLTWYQWGTSEWGAFSWPFVYMWILVE